MNDMTQAPNRQSERVALVKPSPSMAVSQAAKALKAKGINVIDLGLGEPDFDTPHHIIEAAHEAALAGNTRYTATDGGPEIKWAVQQKFKRENDLDFELDQISVSNGAKQVLFNALMATMNPSDEVIIPTPYFVSYPDMVLLVGGKPVSVPCGAETGFKLPPDQLEAAITDKTRWLLLNSPGNPSGAVYTRTELEALGAVLAKYPHVMILSDEIYEHILFDGADFTSFGQACPHLLDRTIIMNGVSKAYAMTGWRIGYGAGPKDLIKAMGKVQSQSTTNPCSIAQAGAVAALNGPQDFVRTCASEFEARRNLVVEGINRIEGLEVSAPAGAFYAFIKCEGVIGKTTTSGQVIENDADFAQYLLNEGHVASVPGVAYGLEPYFRISTALSRPDLVEAVSRIEKAVTALKG